jgi:hypothetical protein
LITFGQALRGRGVGGRDRREARAHRDGASRPRIITIPFPTLASPFHGFDLTVLANCNP